MKCWAGWLITMGLCSGCVAPKQGLYPPREGETTHPIHVIGHGVHTGLVLPMAEVMKEEEGWPFPSEFLDFAFVEIGWGDRAFYVSTNETSGMAARALFWPTRSALHVAAFNEPVEVFYPE